MPEQVGNARWNPEIERLQREQLHYGGPEEEDEICDVCGFNPCRCDEIDAVTEGLEKRDVKIAERGKRCH